MNRQNKTLLNLIEDAKRIDVDWLSFIPKYRDLEKRVTSIIGEDLSSAIRVGVGGNSIVYKIGSFALKIGAFHNPESFYELDELNRIYLRENIEFQYEKGHLYLGIEIQDYLESDIPILESELRNLYISVRNRGYVWGDAKMSNVNRNKDNYPKIIDSDYIYLETDDNLRIVSELSKKFEIEYQSKE